MEDLLTLMLIILVVYMVYQYGKYKELTKSPPCKIIYKVKEEKEEKNVI
tara:strand:- start:8928 stop:9074 length:147 start_codon:yes stop_codon:yes gene_type:complete